jgi:hypothetical protein
MDRSLIDVLVVVVSQGKRFGAGKKAPAMLLHWAMPMTQARLARLAFSCRFNSSPRNYRHGSLSTCLTVPTTALIFSL